MLPVNHGGHAAYQNFLFEQLKLHYPDPSAIDRDTWDIIERFYYKDLSEVDILMRPFYSIIGAPPRLPSHMLRSILVSTCFKIHSYTKWARQLKLNPLYAILSGFQFGDTPGIGTFYDFNHRLWDSDDKNLKPHVLPIKESVKKPKKSGEKADPITKVTVEALINKFLSEPFDEQQPYTRLFDIFNSQFLAESQEQGLIDLNNLELAGDGTPAATSAQQRKKRVCNCKDKNIDNCSCDRYYSQPDCDIGWDSHRKRFYHGYDLYLLTSSNSKNDLPIFPLFGPASRHDSHGLIYSLFHLRNVLSTELKNNISKLILDSAHDAMALYQYCKQVSITPFIDLNLKNGVNIQLENSFSVGKDGVPICKEGIPMRRNGTEPSKKRLKFRCPRTSRKDGNTCENPCSDAKFGKVVHIPTSDNPRIFNIPPRESKQWKDEYKARTSAERANKRIKNDYQLENGKYRSSREWYCRLFAILMCIHLDAWALPQNNLKNSLLQAA